MCTDCGCSLTPAHPMVTRAPVSASTPSGETLLRVNLIQSLHQQNDVQAEANRQQFSDHGVLVLNLMSSPGAGKTSLLEASLRELSKIYRCAVLEGDLETDLDARRIQALGIQAVQISTGNACHLDAQMVAAALPQLDLDHLDLLFIENVGNLVCPASFDLGQHANVVLLSTTEGDDKPAKYPVMFRAADLLLISKCDLLPVLQDFDPDLAQQALRRLASNVPLLQVSARTGAGLAHWLEWVQTQRQALLAATLKASATIPAEPTP